MESEGRFVGVCLHACQLVKSPTLACACQRAKVDVDAIHDKTFWERLPPGPGGMGCSSATSQNGFGANGIRPHAFWRTIGPPLNNVDSRPQMDPSNAVFLAAREVGRFDYAFILANITRRTVFCSSSTGRCKDA